MVVITWKRAGQRDQGGRAEQRDGLQEHDDERGEDRGHGQRQGDAQRGPREAGAEGGGGVLELRRDQIERGAR